MQQHFNACRKHGLADEWDELRIGLVGTRQQRDDARTFLRWFGDHTIVAEADTGWEQVTLWHLQSTTQPTDRVFYAHTKGAASGTQFADDWRKSMCYDNVVKWRDRLLDLETHTTSGAYWVNSTCPEHREHKYFYGGNYWWGRGDYLRELPPLRNDHRYQAEGWIGLHDNPRPANCRTGYPERGNFYEGSL